MKATTRRRLMQKLYQEITDRISAELEKGVVPWRRDWTSTDAGIPGNALTAHVYRGVNVPLLWLAQQRHSWPTLKFVTFKQARELGGTVRGGQKSTGIVFTKPLQVEDKASGEKKTIHMLRWYWVFNVAQCDGLPAKITNPEATREPINPDTRDPEIDAFVAATEVPVFGGKDTATPVYFPAVDHIKMPPFDAFESAHGFYA